MAPSWPFTSAKSGPVGSTSGGVQGGVGERETSPFRWAHSCATVSTPYTSSPWAREASGALSAGTNSWRIPQRTAARAMGRIPDTGRSAPDRDSSPKKAASAYPFRGSWPLAERMPSKMGRSYTVPTFFRSAGARLMVMRETGKSKPLERMAERTRSRDSFTAASGRPTTSKAGSPPDRAHSAVTGYPWMPLRPRESRLHTMGPHSSREISNRNSLPSIIPRGGDERKKTCWHQANLGKVLHPARKVNLGGTACHGPAYGWRIWPFHSCAV